MKATLTITLICIVVCFGCADSSTKPEIVIVSSVIDGDTIKLSDGTVIKYIGIDAPGVDTSDGIVAKEANQKLVEGRAIKIELDKQQKDQDGRTLAYVYVNNVFVNLWLVQNGYARVATSPPNTKYQRIFENAQKEAASVNRGIWKPSEKVATSTGTSTHSSGCADPCVWVNGYRRKDGTYVKGHWRSKPGCHCPKAN